MERMTRTEAETEQIGTSLAAQLRPGDVLLLYGDLGAGKSVFARGLARGLGISGPVTSPTFTLLNVYQGRLALHHFDLYRLDSGEEFEAAGLSEYVGGEAVALVEWPQRALEALPARHLAVEIAYGDSEGERYIRIRPMGGFREVEG